MAQNSQLILNLPMSTKGLTRKTIWWNQKMQENICYNQCWGPESLALSVREWPPATRLLCNWCLFGREAGGHLIDMRTESSRIPNRYSGQSQGPTWDSWNLGWRVPQSRDRGVHREQSEDWKGRAPQPLCKDSLHSFHLLLCPRSQDLSPGLSLWT